MTGTASRASDAGPCASPVTDVSVCLDCASDEIRSAQLAVRDRHRLEYIRAAIEQLQEAARALGEAGL